jgi:hypothetical protein
MANGRRGVLPYCVLSCSIGACIVLAACGGGSKSSGQTQTRESNTAPTIDGTPQNAAATGATYSFQPNARDAEDDVLTFHIDHRPPWATFSIATGRLRGTPSAADVGSYEDIVITVTDGAELTALEPFTITVGEPGTAAATLSWRAPTENTNGSPLTDRVRRAVQRYLRAGPVAQR